MRSIPGLSSDDGTIDETEKTKDMKKLLFALYEIVIGIPLFLCTTVFCAIFTMLTIPWANSRFVHAVQVWWARSFCRIFWCGVSIDGIENIDPKQSYVFVSNHQSLADVFVVYGWLPVIFKWIMKKELRRIPLVGTACKAAGHIFLDRKSRKSAIETIKEAESILHDGVSVVIFPEGTRSTDGQVGAFKRGAFQIAFDLNLPIVPLSLSGCREVCPKDSYIIRLGKHIHMHIGQPRPTENAEQSELIEQVRQDVIAGIK